MKRATGFALLTPERRKEMAALGGKTAHAKGTAPKFEKGSEEARLAGRKGGEARRRMLAKTKEQT